MKFLLKELQDFFQILSQYSKIKIARSGRNFEKLKNISVEVLMWRRGILQKRIWHVSLLLVATVGIFTSGVLGGDNSIVSSTYPGVGGPDPRFVDSFEPFPDGVVIGSAQDTQTNVSQKPRSEIIEYRIKSGDTLSEIGKKFGISKETIQWANDLSDADRLKPGEILKILPVTGVAYEVKSGDTVASVAKKYQADAQAIVDYPFNDVPDDFRLKIGQVLIIPDGTKEEAPKKKLFQPQYIAQGPASPVFQSSGGGNFVWPTTTVGISQYYAWYHPGIDLPNPSHPPVAAADGGVVKVAGWPDSYGYGNRVVVDHGNGYQTLYAHLSNIYVSVGQTVSRGQVLGQMGSTGRSTGTHLHFEIHYKGVPVNPLAILK